MGMVKKTVTYEDFSGDSVTETLYFKLNRTELLEMDKAHGFKLDEYLGRLLTEKAHSEMTLFVKELLMKAYGEKDSDNRHFVKSEEMAERFAQSLAFDVLFETLMDEKEAGAFVDGLMKIEP